VPYGQAPPPAYGQLGQQSSPDQPLGTPGGPGAYAAGPPPAGLPGRGQPPKKTKTGLIIGIVVAVLALGGGGVYWATQINGRPGPTPTTSTSTSKTPVPTYTPKPATPTATPASTTTPTQTKTPSPSVKAPTHAISMDTVNAFFKDAVTDPAEQDFHDGFLSSATDLMDYLATTDVNLAAVEDPFVGEWNVTTGPAMKFDGDNFTYYQSGSNMTDNYDGGKYMVIPGCKLAAGFATTYTGLPCYSVFTRIVNQVTNGQRHLTVFYGGYQLMGFAGAAFSGYDQRTNEQITISIR